VVLILDIYPLILYPLFACPVWCKIRAEIFWRNEMKILVIYDTQYGNTEKIAKAIAGALGRTPEAG